MILLKLNDWMELHGHEPIENDVRIVFHPMCGPTSLDEEIPELYPTTSEGDLDLHDIIRGIHQIRI